MKKRSLFAAATLILSMVALVGCSGAMKVTFTNHTPATVEAEVVTQGHVSPVQIGDIPPGEHRVKRFEFDKEMLQAEPKFSITVDGGTPGAVTKVITIPQEPYKKLHVDIESDSDRGTVIIVTDPSGRPVMD